MPMSQLLTATLREWSETFMHRSMRDFGHFMREAGLSMPQMTVLFHLYYHGRCGVSDIGNHLDVTSPAASQLIDRLVQQGLAARSEDPEDRRVRQIDLTPQGQHLVQEAIEARVHWIEELAGALQPAEQASVSAALRLLTESVRRIEAGRPSVAGYVNLREKE